MFRIICIIGFIVVIALLFRVGAAIPAGALTFILFLVTLYEQSLRIKMMKKNMERMDASSGTQVPEKKKEVMSVKQAREVLGVSDKASESDIRAAYVRMMKQAHPDSGGSNYLAAQINNAKDILLNSLSEPK